MKHKAVIEVGVSQVANRKFPVWLECNLTDYDGTKHSIIEKVPVLTSVKISTKQLPSSLKIECTVIGSQGDQITIELSHGIESTEGVRRFTVNRSIYHAS